MWMDRLNALKINTLFAILNSTGRGEPSVVNQAIISQIVQLFKFDTVVLCSILGLIIMVIN